MSKSYKIWQGLAAGMLLLSVVILYWSGLHGAFLLDDYQNLKALGGLKDGMGWKELQAYATAGFSGPLGRPVSLLTFALQHGAWPDSPAAFKAVNLGLHLATGALLFMLFLRLGELNGLTRESRLAAALGASALWLLAPLHVSTVLYAVQRMTILSAFFSVAAINAWVFGRALLAVQRKEGWAWITLGLGLGGVLAVLSKENGVLLPLFLLVIDRTLLRNLPAPPGLRVWKAALLWGPLLVVSAIVAIRFHDWVLPGYASREFSLGERLLTEPRILVDYLRMALLPSPGNLGLFHDDYPVSRGLWAPATTLPAMLFIAGLVLAAWKTRSRWPVFSFGVLWFFAGHLLESSFLPLELYFEHRNYLPSAGLYFALAVLAVKGWEKARTPGGRRGVAAIGLIWLGMFGWITWNESRLWGNPLLQAEVWYKHHPTSIRARERLGSAWAIAGNYQRAAGAFAQLARSDYPAGYLLWWQAACYDDAVDLPPAEEMLTAFARAPFSDAPMAALEELVLLKEEGKCRRLSGLQIEPAVAALLGNPNFVPRRAWLFETIGRWRAAEGHFEEAREALEQAFVFSPKPELALLIARVALAEQRPDLARMYLSKGMKIVAGMAFAGSYPAEFAELSKLAGEQVSISHTTQ